MKQVTELAPSFALGFCFRSLYPLSIDTYLATVPCSHFGSAKPSLHETAATADIRRAMDRGERFLAHAFEYACTQSHINHLLTKPRHPRTNGQAERLNRPNKGASVKRFHYEAHDQI